MLCMGELEKDYDNFGSKLLRYLASCHSHSLSSKSRLYVDLHPVCTRSLFPSSAKVARDMLVRAKHVDHGCRT